ncbi:MAG: hypothetical protein AAF393_08975 [Pseudomonadota bacterium]
MRVTTLILAVFLIALPVIAKAQSAADFLECRSTSDDVERLKCYDNAAGIGRAGFLEEGACKGMSLLDLKLDHADLVGKCVGVSATVMPFGEFVLLSDGVGDTAPLVADFNDLPRDQRSRILSCQMCKMNVTGMVTEVMFQKGLLLKSAN